MTMPLVAIALGSNLGDRRANMDRALEALDALENLEIVATSSLYESEPWGDTDQGAFLNAVALAKWYGDGGPEGLLAELQALEKRLGKEVVRKWGPRVIDLDLLLFGDESREAEGLHLPHPRIRQRPFVVLPLQEAVEHLTKFPRTKHTTNWQIFLDLDAEGQAIEAQTRRMAEEQYWPIQWVSGETPLVVGSARETHQLGQMLGEALRPGDIVALVGPMGAGKTCLAGGIAAGLGVSGPIASPTYTLCREYRDGRHPLQHWDFYRLEDEADLESTGFLEALEIGAVLVVEWADRFWSELPPERTLQIFLAFVDGDRRVIGPIFDSKCQKLPFRARLAFTLRKARELWGVLPA